MQPPDWDAIGERLGLPDARDFAWSRVRPVLYDVAPEELDRNGQPKQGADGAIGLAFGAFVVTFTPIAIFVRDTWWSAPMKFVLFFVLFLAYLGAALWLNRDRLGALMLRGFSRMRARAEAMESIARGLGLDYLASPAGPPAEFVALKQLSFLPAALRDLGDAFESNDQMADVVEAVRQSGLAGSGGHGWSFLNGFRGHVDGMAFSAVQAQEKQDEGDDIHHLLVVLKTRHRLQGATQLRSLGAAWPDGAAGRAMQEVRLESEAFSRRFRVRATDQVEARLVFAPDVMVRLADLSVRDKLRACAFGHHVVIDLVGGRWFEPVNVLSGAWDEQSVAGAMTDVADMLDMARATSRAFGVRA